MNPVPTRGDHARVLELYVEYIDKRCFISSSTCANISVEDMPEGVAGYMRSTPVCSCSARLNFALDNLASAMYIFCNGAGLSKELI